MAGAAAEAGAAEKAADVLIFFARGNHAFATMRSWDPPMRARCCLTANLLHRLQCIERFDRGVAPRSKINVRNEQVRTAEPSTCRHQGLACGYCRGTVPHPDRGNRRQRC